MKHLIFTLVLFSSLPAFPTTLALNWKAEPEFGGFYAAALKGLYKKQGIDLKIIEGGSGTPTVQMLANDKVEFAIVSADEIIMSHDRNPKNKVKALFAVYQTSPYIVMTHAERGFKNLQEVFAAEGFLSIQSGLPFYQFLTRKFGKPRAKVVPYLGGVGNFLADKKFSQQGFVTMEPLSAETNGAKVKNFLIADEGFNPYLVVLATTEKTLQNNPDLVKKVVAASRQGWVVYLENPLETNQHMALLNKSLSLETFNKSAEVQKPLIQDKSSPLGSMTLSRWESLLKQMQDLQLIKKPLRAQEFFINP